MSEDISLLPEGMRKKEDDLKKTEPTHAEPAHSELRFSTPVDDGEDIEVIEIDEGEVDQVLAGESFLTRALFKAGQIFDDLKDALMKPQEMEPPPKLPPQFFSPPPTKPKPPVAATPAASPTPRPSVQAAAQPASSIATPSASPVVSTKPAPVAAKMKPRIVPAEKTPRRVRVIRRVRKPVRVSFVSEEDLKLLHVDVSKRRFTFISLIVLFTVVLAGGSYVLTLQQSASAAQLASAKTQTSQLNSDISTKQKEWHDFQTLEPRLRALIGLLDSHVSPTQLLQLIERNTLTSVSYTSFSYTNQKVDLGVLADSYESAAKQIVAFQRVPEVTKVESSGYTAKYDSDGSRAPSSVQFDLTLTLSSNALTTSATSTTP